MIKNGKIATVDRNFSYVEAVACRNGYIIDRGANAEIEAYIGPDTKVIDALGRLVLPAANDSISTPPTQAIPFLPRSWTSPGPSTPPWTQSSPS